MVAEAGLDLCLTDELSVIGSASRFAVPCVRLADDAAALHTDRCTALPSLLPPQAAVGSLTQRAALVGLITKDDSCEACCHNKKDIGLFTSLCLC